MEKLISNFSFSSRLDFFASRQPLETSDHSETSEPQQTQPCVKYVEIPGDTQTKVLKSDGIYNMMGMISVKRLVLQRQGCPIVGMDRHHTVQW